MVLISLDPFTYRKIFLVAVALLGLSAVCFADPVLMARRYAPNHSWLDLPKAIAPTGRESEKPGKVRMVGPELGALDAIDLAHDDTEWRTPPSLANLIFATSGIAIRLVAARYQYHACGVHQRHGRDGVAVMRT